MEYDVFDIPLVYPDAAWYHPRFTIRYEAGQFVCYLRGYRQLAGAAFDRRMDEALGMCGLVGTYGDAYVETRCLFGPSFSKLYRAFYVPLELSCFSASLMNDAVIFRHALLHT